MSADRRVIVHRDIPTLTGSVAARFITKVVDLLDEQELVHVSLTGGGVGTGILAAINDSPARDSIDWSRVHVWWSDERFVPAGDAERNDTGARAALLDHIAIPAGNVHPFPALGGGEDLDGAAVAHAAVLATWGGDRELPVFDILFLGVGPDGHVASLFPETPGVLVTTGTVIAVRNAPKPPPERLSLTFAAINSADRIWLALAGADKASALGLALAGAGAQQVPAAGVRGMKRTVFFVDATASAEVPVELIASDY